MKSIYLFIILFSFSQQFVSQTTEESITEIRKMYKETENVLKNCDTIISNEWTDDAYYNGLTSTITAYYDKRRKEIVKIVEYGGGDWHEEKASYYLRDGKLFFAFIEANSADEMYTGKELAMSDEELHESGGEAKSMNYSEVRLYITDWQVIRDLTKQKTFPISESNISLKEVENVKQDVLPANYESIFGHFNNMEAFLKTKI